MKTRNPILVFCALAVLISVVADESHFNTGNPFGPIEDHDIEALSQFSKTKGLDVIAEIKRAYGKEEASLAAVFRFSLQFNRLDRNARTYGQIVYSSLLDLGESWGVENYARVLAKQEPRVRQRIRDFLFYDVTQAPKNLRKKAEAETRKDNPELFPADYVFGRDDPIFEK